MSQHYVDAVSMTDSVRVRLSPELLAKLESETGYKQYPDEDGYTYWQLWVLIRTVGPYVNWGSRTVIGAIQVRQAGAAKGSHLDTRGDVA